MSFSQTHDYSANLVDVKPFISPSCFLKVIRSINRYDCLLSIVSIASGTHTLFDVECFNIELFTNVKIS